MQITYDTKADAMYIKFQDGKFLLNKEIKEGIVLDIGEKDILLGIEVLDASHRFKLKDLAHVDIQMPLNLASMKEEREAALL